MKHIALKITAFIFGIALWLYVMSLNTFKVTMDVPVRLVRLPELLAIASKPPHFMEVTLEGAPFDLMRLKSKLKNNDTTVAAIEDGLRHAAYCVAASESALTAADIPGLTIEPIIS